MPDSSHRNSGNNRAPTSPGSKSPKDSMLRKVTVAELETLKEQITDLVYKNPDKAGTLLSLWLKQDAAIPQLNSTKKTRTG